MRALINLIRRKRSTDEIDAKLEMNVDSNDGVDEPGFRMRQTVATITMYKIRKSMIPMMIDGALFKSHLFSRI